ncbi:PAS domain S-box protein [Microcoleus sp. D3_18a_C4]|uniref:PAS domain S-box protein n=1 Tax=Microcoleus sp. D3_18a_C4 TaxID=3055332 RepID=UPI002FCE7E84
MKSSVRIEESKSTKFSNLLHLLWTKITAAVTRIEKAEGSKEYEKKISVGTIAPGSVFSILIIVLLVLNGWLVAGNGDNFYDSPLALGFLGIANIVFLAVSAHSNTSCALAGSDRPSSEPNGGDRFFSLSPDMLCVIGFDGYFKRINPAAEKILGYSEAEMVGQLFIEFVHPDDREATLKQAESIAAGNNTVGFENRWRCRNGSYKWIAWTATPFCEEELMYGIGREITDPKLAQQSLQQSNSILRSVIESTPDVIFVKDIQGRYAIANSVAADWLSTSVEAMIGKDDTNFFPPEIAQQIIEADRRLVTAGEYLNYEEIVPKNGENRTLLTTKCPWKDAEGNIIGVVGVSRDISDRKEIEAALIESNILFENVIESTGDSIFVKDTQSRYLLLNSTAAGIIGLPKSEIIGKKDAELFPPEIAQMLVENDRRIWQSGIEETIEEVVKDSEGNILTVLATKSPLRDRAGNITGVVGVARDISDRKKAEAALQESQRFIEQIANATPNILYLYDEIEQRNVYNNREITVALGYTVEEVQKMGSSLLPTIIHPDDLAKFPEYLQPLETAPDGEVGEYEYRVRDKNGCWRWLVSREIVFSRTEEGKIKQRLGAATDITERKIAEQALAEQLKLSLFTADVGIGLTQNQTLLATLQYCADAVVRHLDVAFARIWTLNQEGNVLELQASAGMYTRIDGAHSRIAVGEFKIGLIALERQPHITNSLPEDPHIKDKEWAAREGMVAFAGYPLIVDNQLLGVMAMFARQELNESTLIALASSADAIALGIKRKQTEVALATQKQTLRAIIDNAPIWVWMANASGRMLLVNKTFCEDVAIPESRFLAASHYSEVLGLEQSANCMASDAQAWSQDIPCYTEEIIELTDGEYHQFDTIKTKVKDDCGNAIGLIGLGLDVTKQKEAQRQLQKSEARFRKLAEQEALLNQLASNIRESLDLDTILATTVQQIRDLLQLDRCQFIWYLPDASPPVWNVRYEAKNADWPSRLGLYPVEPTASMGERIANLEIIQIDDVEALTDPAEREFLMSVGLNSLLDIPLQTQSGQIGAILCGACSGVRLWRDEEVELLMAVGTQLAIAINQAELYEKSRLAAAESKAAAMQQKLLNQLGSQIRASLDLDTILATTVRQIRDLLQLDRCLFMWYTPEAETPAWDIIHEAKNDDLLSLLGYYPAEVTGTLAQKIANLEIYQIDDVTTFSDPVEREFFLQVGYKSVLDLPVKSAGGLTGVVGCTSCREIHRWTKDEVELLSAICDQLSIAISQAELYTQSVDSARIAQEQAAKLEVTLCELKLAQTQLVQAEKMSSLGQMVAGIAHEINNPVSFIFGNLTYTEEYARNLMKLVQMYRDEYPEPSPAIQEEIEVLELDFVLEDLPKMLSSMQVGATRIRDIVRSLRNFSRLDESDMKKVNIHEGIDSTLMILEHRLKVQPDRPAIQLVKEYGQLPLVECYAGLLNQVFMNIIANAIDVLQPPLENPGIIRIRTEVEGTLAVIRIADNGAGMTAQVKQRIFDPFYTTKPIGSGTGMGLAISHSIIVEKHKGEINCISAVGKGTEFTLKIPIKSTEN